MHSEAPIKSVTTTTNGRTQDAANIFGLDKREGDTGCMPTRHESEWGGRGLYRCMKVRRGKGGDNEIRNGPLGFKG